MKSYKINNKIVKVKAVKAWALVGEDGNMDSIDVYNDKHTAESCAIYGETAIPVIITPQ